MGLNPQPQHEEGAVGAEYFQPALTPASPSHAPSRLLPGEQALSQALQVPVCVVCVCARGRGGGALGSLWVGQQEGALPREGFLEVVWEGQIWGQPRLLGHP